MAWHGDELYEIEFENNERIVRMKMKVKSLYEIQWQT
jgi:hypothetical protein